ncbi:E3 ubiquitin-protein ligase RING2 [Halotydeus destructor]|nr:E3 ubiquitin-protein ligase RING2 [Halotydeus destructor]
MMSADPLATGKTWELSLYELHRQPQDVINDNTEIAVSPRSLHNELMCPICLDMLKNTMTTKECLHRFCQECIITALRSGNKECPTCRKKLISKRSLRPDPNFDMLISKIYPNRDEYEAHQERVFAKLTKQNLATSFEEGLRLQALSRAQKIKKMSIGDGSPLATDDSGPKKKKSIGGDSIDHEHEDGEEERSSSNSTPTAEMYIPPKQQEVELVFKPLNHDNAFSDPSLTQTRYIKTTTNASVEHLVKYLSMRHTLDCPNGSDSQEAKESSEESLFTLYLATGPGQFQPLTATMNIIEIVTEKSPRNRPLELHYAYKLRVQPPAEWTLPDGVQ